MATLKRRQKLVEARDNLHRGRNTVTGGVRVGSGQGTRGYRPGWAKWSPTTGLGRQQHRPRPAILALAHAFSALCPPNTNEKRWVDGVLARNKGLVLRAVEGGTYVT